MSAWGEGLGGSKGPTHIVPSFLTLYLGQHHYVASISEWNIMTFTQGGAAAAIHTWLLCPATPAPLPNLLQYRTNLFLYLDVIRHFEKAFLGHIFDRYLPGVSGVLNRISNG